MALRKTLLRVIASTFLPLCLPLAVQAGPADDAYIAARDTHLAALAAAEKAGQSADAVQKQDTAAIQDLEKRMIALLGPLRFKGVAPEAMFSPGTLLEGDLETGLPDGLRFFDEKGMTRIFVSPEPVFLHWLAIATKEPGAPTAFGEGLKAAMTTDEFYRQSVGADAAFSSYMELPLSPAEGESLHAGLGLFSQDTPANHMPDAIVVARVANGRVTVGTLEAKVAYKAIPACTQIWKASQAKADKLRAAGPKGQPMDDARMDQVIRAEAEGSAAFRECFAREIKTQPAFAATLSRAETLLKMLRGG